MNHRRPSRVDVAVAAGVLLVALLETSLNSKIAPRGAAYPCEVVLAVALLWRRVAALGVVAVVALAQVIEAAAGVPLQQPIVPLLASVIAIYSLVVTAPLGRAIAGAGIGLVAVGIETGVQRKGIDNFAFAAVFVAGAVLVGRTVAHRTHQVVQSQQQVNALQRSVEENARATAAAAQQERARIARELHDIIAHSLSLMVIQAGAAEQVLDRKPHQARAALRTIQATGREALTDMAHLVGILREDSSEIGLAPQPRLSDLPQLVEQARTEGMHIEFAVEGEPRVMPSGPELSLYRIVQESLTNVRKHAAGAHTSVRIHYSAQGVEADVVNNRSDSTPEVLPPGGHGLIGMRERVSIYGGSLHAGPDDRGGYRVHAQIPLETDA